MKHFLRISSLIFVAVFMFALTACGKKDDNNNNNNSTVTPLTTAQVITMMSDLIDLDNPNFTATINAEYEMIQQVGASQQTDSNALENIIFKIASNGVYLNVPEDVEAYQLSDASYVRYYDEGAWGDYAYSQEESAFPIQTITQPMELMLKDAFANVVNYNSNWVSSTKLSSGAYRLTVNADLKNDLNSLKTIIINGGDDTLGALLSDILAIHYGSTMTVEKIITDIKANITSTSTLNDVLTFVENEFGFSLQNSYAAIMLLMSSFDSEANMPALTDNFFTLIEMPDDATFVSVIDNFYTNYLNNSELTLNTFLSSVDDTAPEMLQFIKNIILSLPNITINDSVVNLSITTNAAQNKIELLSLTASFSITMGDTTMGISASASIAFSNIGTTSIVAPVLQV